jgi:hypothetical protein
MAEVLSPCVNYSGENSERNSRGFHAVYIHEHDGEPINNESVDEEDYSFPKIASVESLDPTQFLQEEMFIEDERQVIFNK